MVNARWIAVELDGQVTVVLVHLLHRRSTLGLYETGQMEVAACYKSDAGTW